MRMWGVNPKMLCDSHLLGEHFEMHKLVGAINKGKRVQGYINRNLVDVQLIKFRHDQLVDEMTIRGMKHNTPLEGFHSLLRGSINIEKNIAELYSRCEKCRIRIIEFKKESE
jgi:hypothetical protein